ncbi:MAG: ATP-binding protein [Desulfobacteraceae bacterium]|nr:ATP-binding protein [Desulfobacteraceae bacterium]MDH3956576.1 ATP-binding protein [Desulfobacteraceae bacterium]
MKKDVAKIETALRQIEQLNLRLATLNAISKIIGSRLNLDEILSSTIDKILDAPEPESVSIYLLNDGGKVLNLTAHKGLSENLTNNPFMRSREPGNGLLGQTLLDGKPKVVDNTLQSNGPYVDLLIEEGFKSTVYIPLTTKGASIGVMCVSSLNPNTFSSEFVEFLTVIGNHIGVAVDNANMHKNIKEAYQDLKEVQEQIVWTEKLASLGKLAATIAHEINNPLAGVLNYIRLIIKQLSRDRFTHEKLEDISRYLKIMESETARCGEIVKDLLAFARRTKITMESNVIEDIINKTLNLISHELEMKELQLKKNIAPNLPKVKCDFKQIQQVLLNLMYNASEAMPSGGTLTITANRANAAKALLEVAISDTGCGISEKNMENIFEPFFTTKEEGKGVGLGLSVVYGIIARHNGTISVESEPGKGSTFKVRLPFS